MLAKLENKSIQVQEALKKINPAESYLGTLSDSGRESMRSRLNSIARYITHHKNDTQDYLRFDWSSLRRFHYEQIMHMLNRETKEDGMPLYSPSHLKTTWMALRKVAEQTWSLGLMDSDDFLKIKSLSFDFGQAPVRGRAVGIEEVRSLIEHCLNDSHISGVRDAAIIAIIFGTGMRRQELSNIDISNINLKEKVVRFLGKRRTINERPLPDSVIPVIYRYIEELRGFEDGVFFCRIRKSGEMIIDKKGLTPHGIYYIITKRVQECSIKHSSPHDFRRGLATFLLNDGVDIVEVRDILGHKSISTTQVYVKKDMNRIRETVNRFEI